jgi:hypothetical protein
VESVKVVFDSSDLASRTAARGVRVQVEGLLNDGSCVELDLSLVQSVSDSYADELFGVLALGYGLDVFKKYIKLTSATDYIVKQIARNIHYRLHSEIAA